MQHAVKSSRMDVVKSIFGEKLLSVCARPGESLWVHSNGVNGKPAFHRRANLSWLSKICNRFGEIDSGSRKSLTLIKQKWSFFGKKTLYGHIFTNVFQNPTYADTKHVFLCKFREIWPTGSWWNRALFNGQKNKTSALPPEAASSRIAPKSCQGQPQTVDSAFAKFHPNPFTSGGVIAERANIVQTRHKVFAILGEASASSMHLRDYWVEIERETECHKRNTETNKTTVWNRCWQLTQSNASAPPLGCTTNTNYGNRSTALVYTLTTRRVPGYPVSCPVGYPGSRVTNYPVTAALPSSH